jgi:hypothetical protein
MIKVLEKLLYIRYIVGQNEKLDLRQLNKPDRDRIFCSFAVITANIRFFISGLFYFKREVKNVKTYTTKVDRRGNSLF